ncbi:hypothetical protein TRFO_14422 [Tritrichomonas foetus]|uniref:Rnh202 triple barrel domain-containing protein n=1 Tax=Tritrichomonas foetus TaxID=1144522 RepID=A0A1J4KW16_9EUKA|nr:hypothetical protein TRFO_14422 [Tritrichomonas foetus]|eukprot:OHT15080.1 hypothetical protein TRFO_14422 [Tritrichomonas foetus]
MTKVALLPNQIFDNSPPQIILLPHPRTGKQSPFLIHNEKLFEIFDAGQLQQRSFFVGNQLIMNGQIIITSEIHPIIVVFPLMKKRGNEFFLLERYFFDTPYIQIASLVLPCLKNFGDFEVFYNQSYWGFDEKKFDEFIDRKFGRLCEYVRITSDLSEMVIQQRAFDILRHYLPIKYMDFYRDKLSEKFPDAFPKIILRYSPPPKVEQKPKVKKIIKKRIPKYLRNNTVITSFFKPQKVKT